MLALRVELSDSMDEMEDIELIDESDETEYCRGLLLEANSLCNARDETATTVSQISDTVDMVTVIQTLR